MAKKEPLYPHIPKSRKGDLRDEVKFKVGDRVSAPKVPVKGTVKAKGGPFAVQIRWDDGEWGWCDVRDLTKEV